MGDSGSEVEGGRFHFSISCDIDLQSCARDLCGRRIRFIGFIAQLLNAAVIICRQLLLDHVEIQAIDLRHRSVIPEKYIIQRETKFIFLLPDQRAEYTVTKRDPFIPSCGNRRELQVMKRFRLGRGRIEGGKKEKQE